MVLRKDHNQSNPCWREFGMPYRLGAFDVAFLRPIARRHAACSPEHENRARYLRKPGSDRDTKHPTQCGAPAGSR